MQPEQPTHSTPATTPVTLPEPSLRMPAPRRSLAIALVVSVLFLVAAAAIVVWLVLSRQQPAATAQIPVSDDTKNVKDVTWVTPPMPSGYMVNDQSKLDNTLVLYTNDTDNCTFTVVVTPLTGAGKVSDAVINTIENAVTTGVTITSLTPADSVSLKNITNGKTYTFTGIAATRAVGVTNINYTKQDMVILYKQFGTKAAALAYECKDESWPTKKTELASLVSKFTVTTK